MGISIIVVNFNGEQYLPVFFESIQRSMMEYKYPYEILIYDNDSTDNSLFILNKYEKSNKNVIIYSEKENKGFAIGNNFLVKKAKYDNLLLINNDTKIVDLSDIIEYMNEHEFLNKEVIACTILNGDNTLQQNIFTYPSIPRLVIQLFLLKKLMKRLFKKDTSAAGNFNGKYFSGCCFILSKSLYNKVAGFDEDYFFYHEEADLFMRLEKFQIEKKYFVKSNVIHYGGGGNDITAFSFGNYYLSLYILYSKHYYKNNKWVLFYIFKAAFMIRLILIHFRIPFNASPMGTIYTGQNGKHRNFDFLKLIHRQTIDSIRKYYENQQDNHHL